MRLRADPVVSIRGGVAIVQGGAVDVGIFLASKYAVIWSFAPNPIVPSDANIDRHGKLSGCWEEPQTRPRGEDNHHASVQEYGGMRRGLHVTTFISEFE